MLILGGAGYIERITNQFFLENRVQTTVLDNLSRGHREALVQGAQFVHGKLVDSRLLENLFRENEFDEVLHFAADSLAQESQLDPLTYYRNNWYLNNPEWIVGIKNGKYQNRVGVHYG